MSKKPRNPSIGASFGYQLPESEKSLSHTRHIPSFLVQMCTARSCGCTHARTKYDYHHLSFRSWVAVVVIFQLRKNSVWALDVIMAQSLGKTIKKVHPSNAYICTCSTLVGISGMRHATVRFCLTSTLQNQSNASRFKPSSALLNKRWLIHQSRCNRGPIRSKFRTKADQPRLAATIEFQFFLRGIGL